MNLYICVVRDKETETLTIELLGGLKYICIVVVRDKATEMLNIELLGGLKYSFAIQHRKDF